MNSWFIFLCHSFFACVCVTGCMEDEHRVCIFVYHRVHGG